MGANIARRVDRPGDRPQGVAGAAGPWSPVVGYAIATTVRSFPGVSRPEHSFGTPANHEQSFAVKSEANKCLPLSHPRVSLNVCSTEGGCRARGGVDREAPGD